MTQARKLLAAIITISTAFVAAPVVAAATNGFDAEAATQAYLSTLTGTAREQSNSYFEGGYWLILWGAFIAILAEWILLRSGLSARFRDWGERVTGKKWVHVALYALPYSLIGFLLMLPWAIYTGYFREKQYGLMNQDIGAWFGEQGIGLMIGTIMLMLILPVAMAGIRRSPKRWWLWGAGFASIFVAFLVLISPVFISPLFNDYHEMPGSPVRDRIVAMAESQNVPAENIYVFDQSKQHKRISANVSGLGPTIRISLNDNLLDRSAPPEVAAVMGHELGHYVLGHVWKLILSLTVLFLIVFWATHRAVPRIVRRWGDKWGLRDDKDVAAIPVYSIVVTVMFLLMTPITNSIIRINESEADTFGLDVAREPDGFAKIAMKLSEYRKIEPGRLEEMLFFDHPSGATRVRMAMEWKAKHLAEVEKQQSPE